VACWPFVTVASLVALGCESAPKTAEANTPPAVNATCPVGGHEVEADAPRVAYKGSTIAFCCDHCETKFNKMTEAEKDEVLNKALAQK
jgi:hypothetical protein